MFTIILSIKCTFLPHILLYSVQDYSVTLSQIWDLNYWSKMLQNNSIFIQYRSYNVLSLPTEFLLISTWFSIQLSSFFLNRVFLKFRSGNEIICFPWVIFALRTFWILLSAVYMDLLANAMYFCVGRSIQRKELFDQVGTLFFDNTDILDIRSCMVEIVQRHNFDCWESWWVWWNCPLWVYGEYTEQTHNFRYLLLHFLCDSSRYSHGMDHISCILYSHHL